MSAIAPHHSVGSVRKRTVRWRVAMWCALIVFALFALGNIGIWVVYHGKALPNTHLGGRDVGGMPYSTLQRQLTAGQLLPGSVQLRAGYKTQQASLPSLGLAVNTAASINRLSRTHAWLPLMSLFQKRTVPLVLSIDRARLRQHLPGIAQDLSVAAQPSRVVVSDGTFVQADPEKGFRVDGATVEAALVRGVQTGQATIEVASQTVQAPARTDLSAQVEALQKQIATPVSFAYGGKIASPTTAQKTAWYTGSGQTMAVSPDLVRAYVAHLTPAAANQDDLGLAVQYALGKRLPAHLTVVPAGARTRTYCTAARNVPNADFTDLVGKLALAYADTRGWNDDGHLAFQHVDAGCEYTVWLSAAANVTDFGAICDNFYNCQVGTNVIVNNDRWQKATDPWNATGGSMEDYRTLIINHETGHRLGFADDPVCPGSGQAAPVMMQQSIDLKGCVFNIWPVPAELSSLIARLVQ